LSGLFETGEREPILNRLIGSTYSEEGFMSTALARKASFGGVKLHLTVPKGYSALPISNESTQYVTSAAGIAEAPHFGGSGPNMGEAELLLRPGTRYVIESWAIENGSTVLNGRVLPE
jgi:hypothetical protein